MKALAINKRAMKDTSNSIVESLKNYGLEILTVIGGFFVPVIPMILVTIMFIITDTVIGTLKTKYTSEEMDSNRFKRGILSKSLIYTLLILTVYFLDYFIANFFVKEVVGFEFMLTKGITMVLIGIEVWSIDENFKKITGVSLVAKFKELVVLLKKPFFNFLDNTKKKNT